MLLTIKDLSQRLQIKPSTLYAWAAQKRIPSKKINGLVRFDPQEIQEWLNSSSNVRLNASPRRPPSPKCQDIENLIVRAKEDAYNLSHGETRPKSSLIGKEDADGAV